MQFIKPEEARELMETGLRNELEEIQEKIREAAINEESMIWCDVTNKYISRVKEFLEEIDYTVQEENDDWSDYPTLIISW